MKTSDILKIQDELIEKSFMHLEHIEEIVSNNERPNFYVDKEVIINDNNNHSEMGLPVLRTIETIIGTLL